MGVMEEQNERFDLSESIADLDVRTSKLLEATYEKKVKNVKSAEWRLKTQQFVRDSHL